MSWLALIISFIGLLCSLIAVLGVIAPSLFKDKKTGVVPKRSKLLVGGVVGSVFAFGVAAALMPPTAKPLAAAQPTVAQAPMQMAVDTSPRTSTAEPVQAVAAAQTEQKKPLDLEAARLLATSTLRVIGEAEQSLRDGIQLGDGAGITKHVSKPLQVELAKWSTFFSRPPGDQREHFSYCQDAALKLQMMSASVQRERTVESMKYLRKDEAEYLKAKQQCEQQVKATDSQIKAAVAAEDADLRKRLGGGRECLTVYGVDKQTGQVAAQPKPAHCKNSGQD